MIETIDIPDLRSAVIERIVTELGLSRNQVLQTLLRLERAGTESKGNRHRPAICWFPTEAAP